MFTSVWESFSSGTHYIYVYLYAFKYTDANASSLWLLVVLMLGTVQYRPSEATLLIEKIERLNASIGDLKRQLRENEQTNQSAEANLEAIMWVLSRCKHNYIQYTHTHTYSFICCPFTNPRYDATNPTLYAILLPTQFFLALGRERRWPHVSVRLGSSCVKILS